MKLGSRSQPVPPRQCRKAPPRGAEADTDGGVEEADGESEDGLMDGIDAADVTVQSLKKWFNVLCNHQKQNDEFLIFFDGEEHAAWTAKKMDGTRGITVQPRAADEVNHVEAITAAQAAHQSRLLRRDLDTLLNNFATYVPEAFYYTIIDEATSIQGIHDRLALYCKLSSNKQFVLNSYTIKYDPESGDTPEKLYLRLKAHYSNAAPKAGTTFDGENIRDDVPVNELCELMLGYQHTSKLPEPTSCRMTRPCTASEESSGTRWIR